MRDSDFLSIVSHELRTPITVVTGLAATLAERRQNLGEEQVDQCLQQIRHAGERMAALVDDMLDLSQLEGGRFRVTLEGVRLAASVSLAVEAAPPPPTTSLDRVIPHDLWVMADSARLEQVLINLLTNAYRYGGRAVRLEARRGADHALLTVSDDGEGVAAELVPELFERYSRGANPDDGGSGLGLAIVRALVEAFGGRIWYEPGKPTGARFNVLLPVPERDRRTKKVTSE